MAFRTDLALEARTRCTDERGVEEQCAHFAGIDISRITVMTEEAEEKLDKPRGRYITMTFPKDFFADIKCREVGARRLAREIASLLPEGEILLVGLGNRKVTPDALGPKTMEGILVTRHLLSHCREVLSREVRSVAAFPTGVMGVTGIETAEAVTAMVNTLHPAGVVAVDALAALDSDHIAAMVQLNDTGIAPGAGVGNFRQRLSRETLGVPVLALGVPLVLSTEAILESAFRRREHKGEGASLWEGLEESFLSMVVTPKDIDTMVQDSAKLLAQSLNLALLGEDYGELSRLIG